MVLTKLTFDAHEFTVDPRREYLRLPETLAHLSDEEKVQKLKCLREKLEDVLEQAAADHILDTWSFRSRQENAA